MENRRILKFLPQLLHFAYEMIFNNDDDDDEDKQRIPEEKLENFVEKIIPRFNDMQLKKHFRMNLSTFENLLQGIHNVIPHEHHKEHPQLTIEKQVLLSIWYLANIESFRSVAQRFNVTKSTAWAVLARVGQWIVDVNRLSNIICWLVAFVSRSLETNATLERINGFPGVIGCTDGSHIKIVPPKESPNSYFNRKKFHSVLLQGVCNERKLFIDVFAGVPGSCHDSRLYHMSDLSERTRTESIVFFDDTHLIGDLAYSLTKTMIVRFKDYGNLTARQRNFSIKLSQIRVLIEQTFALLKGRYRRLKFMETVRLNLICLNIIVACILHNVCILNGDNPDDTLDLRQEIEEERLVQVENNYQEVHDRNRQHAVVKRDRIMNILVI